MVRRLRRPIMRNPIRPRHTANPRTSRCLYPRRRYTVSKATDPQSMRDPAVPHRCLNMRQRRHATGRGASPLGMGTAGFAGRSGSAIRRRQEGVAPTARRSPKTLRGRPGLPAARHFPACEILNGATFGKDLDRPRDRSRCCIVEAMAPSGQQGFACHWNDIRHHCLTPA